VGIQKDITRTRNRIRKFFDFHGLAEDFPAGEWNEEDYQRARALDMSSPLRVCLDALYDTLEHLKEVARTLRKALVEVARKERYAHAFQILKSAPGVGWLTAIRLVLEWGEDWRRFSSFKGISGFSGLISSEFSTGETVHKGHITGESAPFVRAWLVQCAWTAIRKDPVLTDMFRRVWRNSGSKKKAIVAVARKLVVRLRALLLNDTPYCLGVVR
jgi:transposase